MPQFTNVAKIKTPAGDPGSWEFWTEGNGDGFWGECTGPSTVIFVMEDGTEVTFPIGPGQTATLHMTGSTVDIGTQ